VSINIPPYILTFVESSRKGIEGRKEVKKRGQEN